MMMETIPSGTILHGRYRIERVLGSGGFGYVYQAVDLHTNQQFAVKEYFVSGAGGQAQLQHEAHVLSQLHHPNLPAFQEAFNERGRYFVVLSYIEGKDLTDLIRDARTRNEIIPLARILGWMLSICDAVIFLHSQRPPVIHRDIKPDNIRIMPDGTAVLVDLGNAKAAADGARTLFFIRHQGTPGYAPQEQYPGGSGTDTRSDVYALGATLYFALTTHEPPNVSTRSQSAQQGLPDLPSLQEQLANNPPEDTTPNQPGKQFRGARPGRAGQRHIRHLAQLGTLPPALLDQLNRIIQRAMAMKPKDRYQSTAEFRDDLQKVLLALPPSTVPSTPPPRAFDPNSTQPDLPLLFETLQEAKDNAGQPPTSSNPPASPSVSQPGTQAQPAPAATCPRCNAPLLPQASFCPRCGSPVTPPQANASAGSKPSAIQSNNVAPQYHAPARDITEDETTTIAPQAQATPPASARTSPPAIAESRVPPSGPSQARSASAPAKQVQQRPAPVPQAPSSSHISPASSSMTGSQPAKSAGSTIHPVLLIMFVALIIFVAVLLLLLVFLLTHHAAHQAITGYISFNPSSGL